VRSSMVRIAWVPGPEENFLYSAAILSQSAPLAVRGGWLVSGCGLV
jgi:hypothetical protein